MRKCNSHLSKWGSLTFCLWPANPVVDFCTLRFSDLVVYRPFKSLNGSHLKKMCNFPLFMRCCFSTFFFNVSYSWLLMPFNTAVSKMFFVIMCTQIRICSAFARPEIEMASIIHNKTAHQLVLHHCFIIVTLHAVKVITEHGLSATNNVLKTPKKRQSDGTQSSVMRLKETFSFFFSFFFTASWLIRLWFLSQWANSRLGRIMW